MEGKAVLKVALFLYPLFVIEFLFIIAFVVVLGLIIYYSHKTKQEALDELKSDIDKLKVLIPFMLFLGGLYILVIQIF